MRILELTRKEFAGGQLTYRYDSYAYYRVEASREGEDFRLVFTVRPDGRRHTEYRTDVFSPVLRDPTLFMLLDNEGERAGFLETCPDESGQVLRVTNLMVEDACRRRGYGALLLSRAKTQARALGCRALSARVPAGNVGAVRFLLSQGLTLTGYTALPGTPGAAPNEPSLELGLFI